MKTYLAIACLSICFYACGGDADKNSAPVEETKKSSAMDNPDYEAGLGLVAKSDCFTCHKIKETSVGPSYSQVAAKYENNATNISLLAEKIIKGGQGVWGEVPMLGHPTVSKEDAEKMVKYILLVKE